MNSECIVTQVHIPDFDVQGGLSAQHKQRLVAFGIQHLRRFNPAAYLIMCGHGHRPQNLDLCDHVYWEDKCLPLNEHGYVVCMPAQFKFVSKGLQHALDKGFTRCLKTRGDCIIGIPNIVPNCDNILNNEQKSLLITQQTAVGRMGDCFMHGDTELLHKIWHEKNPVVNDDGLQNTAHHFCRAVGCPPEQAHTDVWKQLLRKHCAFRDVNILKFMCLRWNYFHLNRLDDKTQQQLLNPQYDFSQYHWGRTQGWHRFMPNGKMLSSDPAMWSAKDFYATSTDPRR